MICSRVYADTSEQVAAYIGAKVMFNPEHPENSEDETIGMIGSELGIILTSEVLVDEEDDEEYHVLSVYFQTRAFAGTIKDATADRFLLKVDA